LPNKAKITEIKVITVAKLFLFGGDHLKRIAIRQTYVLRKSIGSIFSPVNLATAKC